MHAGLGGARAGRRQHGEFRLAIAKARGALGRVSPAAVLLSAPQQLEEIEGVPRRRGSLRFFGDVERIETGWWDGGEIGRDYYTVFDIYGVQLWIFRVERADPHRWFLHGVFG